MGKKSVSGKNVVLVIAMAGMLLEARPGQAADPVALSQVAVPEPTNLEMFVADRNAAIRLGKSLFWDMQVGSDGKTACASCHFHAGTDNRTRNTLHPGTDGTTDGGINSDLTLGDFPFVRFADAEDRTTARTVRDDRVGAQGVVRTRSLGFFPGFAREPGRVVRDDSFAHNGRQVRQATGRNAPSVINAVFNFTNFLDGRANHFFNGVDPFGPMNGEARIHLNSGGALQPVSMADLQLDGQGQATNPYALDNASLASQAVGPVLNDVEMSWVGRTWPEVGRKLLGLRPLAEQEVHPQDSRLGPLRHASGKGLNTTYAALVEAAFHPEFWNSGATIDGYSQEEANFSLFFGLALQMYQSTLVADQTPFDRFLQGDTLAMSESAQRGWGVFSGGGQCLECHIGAELTGASVSFARFEGEAGLIELMAMGDGQLGNYDIGFYNVGATPTTDDPGRGGTAPFLMVNGEPMPLSFTGQHFAGEANLGFPPLAQPGCINNFFVDPPTICPEVAETETRQSVNGAFKTPGLRNVELTGPYLHNGGMATLMQVVDFYTRGGNFHEENLADLDPAIVELGTLRGNPERKRELVDFLLALTDERVRWERAPFDHPQLFVADGHEQHLDGHPKRSRALADRMREIPAVGAAGRTPEQGPLKPFLADDLNGTALANFHYQP